MLQLVNDEPDYGDVLYVGTEQRLTKWIMDSECIFHMCPNKDWFQGFKEDKGSLVFLGDTITYEVLA